MKQVFFITGTDTGVGKTVLTALLAAHLRECGVKVAAFKPLCSGGRDDALALHRALGSALSLDEINPWHFRAPLAPSLAAKLEKKSVKLAHVVAHLRTTGKDFDVMLVEGAGGLLGPLGENFDSRDLLVALRAAPIIVAQNKLGVVNHVLLTLEALSKNARNQALVVLMSPRQAGAAAKSNARLLAQFFPSEKISVLPWLGAKVSVTDALKRPAVRRMLGRLVPI